MVPLQVSALWENPTAEYGGAPSFEALYATDGPDEVYLSNGYSSRG
jgi:hypothetical protein